MDLNASPLPEEDEDNYREHAGYRRSVEEHIESSVETMRREREERRRRLQREDGHRQVVQRGNALSVNPRSQMKPRSIPEGWLDCPPCGQPIGFIIPSKVPLSEFYNDSVPPGRRYSSKQVIQRHKKNSKEIGLVIDLTNTTRYYPSSEWTKLGIKHVKIPCRGRDAVPDNESVNIFYNEVQEFLNRQKNVKPHKYILVHCTHGYNRTGYMIISFLMRSQMMYLTEAIQFFATARPPGIYKADYIDALYTFYHERRPETVVCPPTPEWKRSSDLDLNGEVLQDDEDGDGVAPPANVPVEKEITNDDVLGDAIPFDQQQRLQQACCYALKLPPTNKGRTPFPGSHPVSLSRDNLQLLRTRYYYATWKADGTRYMMLITHHGCYLIDRNFCFRRVQLRFPVRNPSEGVQLHHVTLIDGEMIIDIIPTTDPSTGRTEKKLERRYLAYDLMVLNSESVSERPFSERWKLLEKEVIEPRNIDRRQNPIYRYDLEPFRVRRKDFWLLSTVNKLLKEFIPALSHEADGLIFQGWDDPYVTRTHEGLLKWKYPEMNSVDFLFEEEDGRQLLYLFERGKKKLMEGAHVVFKDDVDVSTISGKVVECSYDQEGKVWSCMRIRMDKSTPNDINTFYKVRKSIEDNITEDVLLEEIGEIVQLPMYADRIARAQQLQHAHSSQRRR